MQKNLVGQIVVMALIAIMVVCFCAGISYVIGQVFESVQADDTAVLTKDNEKKNKHHHHNHGAHLSVLINCSHPAIRRSDDAPGWVLVVYAQKEKLSIEVRNSHEEKNNTLRAEVAIPTEVSLKEYVDGLRKIDFVVEVSVLQEKGEYE